MIFKLLVMIAVFSAVALAQMPAVEPGVSQELAKWRAARYTDVRYKLDLTLEKMSPVLKGTMEIRVNVLPLPKGISFGTGLQPYPAGTNEAAKIDLLPPIVLDWRKIRGNEQLSTISNVSINAIPLSASIPPADAGGSDPVATASRYEERDEHLIFREGVVPGENVIKLDFTSPILTSGSAITRYVDKEDGAEYIYSLFVPSDASTAFPVFDQPDLKARFELRTSLPESWKLVSNTAGRKLAPSDCNMVDVGQPKVDVDCQIQIISPETKPISTYVFAFAAGPFSNFGYQSGDNSLNSSDTFLTRPKDPDAFSMNVFVRKSQAAKFKPHAAEVFRLNREGIKYLETYFDYKFPFPKYDIVLIPEFPFGGMEHAGATFLRESSVIFPQEPTKNDYISRANVIFHEAAHQWFGDTVTMKWFDDLWLKEGFAEFMAYKTLEKVMPEYNAWKVFYERNKQAAYLTDSTKGTTPIYQEIANLNSAKSAYGNIVYRKAPSFLRQAEFYLGPDKFQTAVRAFLKKHEYANAGFEDLVSEFEGASGQKLGDWSKRWITQRGVPLIRSKTISTGGCIAQDFRFDEKNTWDLKLRTASFNGFADGHLLVDDIQLPSSTIEASSWRNGIEKVLNRSMDGICAEPSDVSNSIFFFPNYQDYGYGIFLLDPKSRDYVLKNIGSEKDDFLRTMMWGSLWDSVREGELDPKEYVELVVKNLKLETDESTIQTLLVRVSTAMRYYIDDVGPEVQKPVRKQGRNTQPARIALAQARAFASGVENLLIDRMQNASTPGQKITYYRSFLNIASSENARRIMKVILRGNAGISAGKSEAGKMPAFQATKDRFDIVSRLIILGDPEAPKLLADLEKTETSDEAKRYAYAAKAGFATAESKAKFWNDFVSNKDISESWIEAAFGPFNNVRHSELTLPYLEKALAELPNLKRNRKIFFVNGWLGAFIGGQKSEQALAIVNKFLADNPGLDKDLRLKILENVDVIERAVKIRSRYAR